MHNILSLVKYFKFMNMLIKRKAVNVLNVLLHLLFDYIQFIVILFYVVYVLFGAFTESCIIPHLLKVFLKPLDL